MTAIEKAFKPGRRIDIPSVPNLRDIGGYATATRGRVRTGQLYRSTELNHLHGEDVEGFAKLGISTVFDLRTAAERQAEPDVVPEGTKQVVCDVLKDSQRAAPAHLLEVLSDPAFAEQMLGGGKALQLFERGYREIVSLPSALSAYREFSPRSPKAPTARRSLTAGRARTAPVGLPRRRCCCSGSPNRTCCTTTS